MQDTLSAALLNAHTVFLVTLTVTTYDLLKEREFQQTKAIADAAVNADAKYLIYSTTVHA